MTGYDGPSIFKRNTSDTPSGNKDQSSKQRQGFENPHRKNLPKGVQTRTDIQKEAQTYMQTSPTQHIEQRKTARFRNKYIPPSLQQNNIDEIKHKNEWLYEELTKRLAKDASTYLLFEEKGAEMKQVTPPAEKIQVSKKKPVPVNKTKNKKSKLEKIQKIEKTMRAQKQKPTTGLQRSLSNILEEEQAVLKNKEGHLNSLFTEEKRN